MIRRYAFRTVIDALERQAAVAIIGPRQVGKGIEAIGVRELAAMLSTL